MSKTLYSLMLNEDVVRLVDAAAHRMGTSRSNLINEILAEYVHYTTPERRIYDVLSSMEQLMGSVEDLVPFFAPNTSSLSLKSSLEYKYRPTIKYEVELSRGGGDFIGRLSVLFRTQSTSLIDAMTEFFRLWKRIEDAHLVEKLPAPLQYELYEGRFTRLLAAPEADCSSEQLAAAISDYIQLFDRLMKGYLSGRYDARDIEKGWYSHKKNTSIWI